jgi:MFS family permease
MLRSGAMRATPGQDREHPRTLRRLREALGLERNVAVMSVAVLLIGAGEELWLRFIPKYLEALGAGPATVGLFGTTDDLLDALYQYPGGYLADRIGSRRALVLFGSIAAVGYATYALSRSWLLVFLGLVFVSAWSSMGSPAIFAMIAQSLPHNRRAMGFTVQSVLKRVPTMISPAIGGLLIARFGLLTGIRIALLATICLALVSILVQRRFYNPTIESTGHEPLGLLSHFRALDARLKRLLLSDVFIRTCEGMAGVFVVLFVTNIVGLTALQFGALVSVQMATSIAVYFPAAVLADRYGRKPLVAATFLCFAAFPLAVILARDFAGMLVAFVIGGLRELGEPARKAMIVDLADPARRGRTVGLYYLVRSLSVTPAAAIGGLLWRLTPSIPFLVAFTVGLVGTLLFLVAVNGRVEPKLLDRR